MWRRLVVTAWLLIFIAMVMEAEAQAQAQKFNCTESQLKLAPCATAVIGANPPDPSKECCDGLRSTTAEEVCTCKLLSSAESVQGYNPAAAQAMPAKCKIPVSSSPPPKCASDKP